jgi:Fe-Mn family superoxide dismutase
MAYEVPPLPYDYNALEPHIDEQTMRLHHDKHHQAYVDKANDALSGTDLDGKPVEEALQNLSSLPEDKQTPFRNNGGGHANHSLFWESMSPDGGGEPSGELAEAISSAPSTTSRSSSRPTAWGSSARAGRGWCCAAASSS